MLDASFRDLSSSAAREATDSTTSEASGWSRSSYQSFSSALQESSSPSSAAFSLPEPPHAEEPPRWTMLRRGARNLRQSIKKLRKAIQKLPKKTVRIVKPHAEYFLPPIVADISLVMMLAILGVAFVVGTPVVVAVALVIWVWLFFTRYGDMSTSDRNLKKTF
jgi:hypothetical protein